MERLEVDAQRDSSEHDVSPSADNMVQKSNSKLTRVDAVAMLISLQIGSGIFSSPSQVSKHTPSPGVAILAWLISGLLAWTGATCYAELGTALPVSGGTQEYLRHIYGDGLAFLAAWIWILGVKASGMAALSIIATQYWFDFVFGSNVPDDGWQCKALALTLYAVVVFVNILSIDMTKNINKVMSVLKLLTLAVLVLITAVATVTGLHAGTRPLSRDWLDKNWFTTTNPTWLPGLWWNIGEYTLAIYAGLWAFSGWDNVNIVTEDLQDVSKNLPRAIHISLPIVIAAFVLANVCYYMAIPWSEFDADNAIAVSLGRALLGWFGGLLFALLVSMACVGTVSVNVFTASRLVVAAAHAGWLPQSLAEYSSVPSWARSRFRLRRDGPVSPRPSSAPDQTPVRAMLFMMCLVTLYMATGTFGSLITFIGLAEYVFFAATTIGLLWLRIREPHLPRPYKPALIIPIIFSTVSSCLVAVGIVKAPAQASLLGGLFVVGIASKSTKVKSLWGRIRGEREDRGRGAYTSLVRQLDE